MNGEISQMMIIGVGGTYTNRQMVIKGIWERASKGNRQDLDTLLSLGLLDEDTFK